jgi:hypothetical protein
VKRLVYLNERPLFENLPEREGHFLAVGDTMRRAAAHVGRNEPCPCGSGKKYKHCCLDADQQRLRRSSDIAGVTREEIEATPERVLAPARIAISNTYELQKMDPVKLSPGQLEQYIPGLTRFRLFDRLAEAFEKVGYSDNLKSSWEEAVECAAEAGRKDIAQRLIDARKTQGFTEDQLAPKAYFLMIEDDPEKCLAFLEEKLRTALKSDDTKTLDELEQAVSFWKFQRWVLRSRAASHRWPLQRMPHASWRICFAPGTA